MCAAEFIPPQQSACVIAALVGPEVLAELREQRQTAERGGGRGATMPEAGGRSPGGSVNPARAPRSPRPRQEVHRA